MRCAALIRNVVLPSSQATVFVRFAARSCLPLRLLQLNNMRSSPDLRLSLQEYPRPLFPGVP